MQRPANSVPDIYNRYLYPWLYNGYSPQYYIQGAQYNTGNTMPTTWPLMYYQGYNPHGNLPQNPVDIVNRSDQRAYIYNKPQSVPGITMPTMPPMYYQYYNPYGNIPHTSADIVNRPDPRVYIYNKPDDVPYNSADGLLSSDPRSYMPSYKTPESFLFNPAYSYNKPEGILCNPTENVNSSYSYSKPDDFTISKSLCSILRHSAPRLKLNMNDEGFVDVDDILKLSNYRNITADDILRIVKNNDKQRFYVKKNKKTHKLMIRANQGHSLLIRKLNLKPIEDPNEFPIVIHGTSYEAWNYIRIEGLKKMKRMHIHFATEEPGNGFISGMRNQSQILIYLDLEKAISSGLQFFLSKQRVILSEGDEEGTIAPDFFLKVIDRVTEQQLPLTTPECNLEGNNKDVSIEKSF